MNPLLAVMVALTLTGIMVPPPDGPVATDDPDPLPPVAPPPEPEEGNLSATLTLPDGTQATIVLGQGAVFLTTNLTGGGEIALTEPKYLYLQTCWPCPGYYFAIHTPEGVEGCPVGPEERDEWRVCIWPRETGGQQGIPMYETDPDGDALFVWGDGCIVHERNGLPPQTVHLSGIILPIAGLDTGGACPSD